MGMLEKIVVAMLIATLMFFLYHRIKNQPEAFSKASLSQSASALGILALALIAVVFVMIELLK